LVTANTTILEANEDELRGGRNDDRLRAEDLQDALADSNVVAIVALRGGAWFTRILPLIDFSVLDRRERRVAVFGFSELTPLINIVASHARGVGVYGMGPAFLTYGMKRYAATRLQATDRDCATPEEWMRARLHNEMTAYFQQVVSLIEGRGDGVTCDARLLQGQLSNRFEATFVGGNLTVLSTLIGSKFKASIEPTGRWVLLEDFNDKPERFDRFIGHLTLAGFWEHCAGVLLGDFHYAEVDLNDAITEVLRYHLPQGTSIPILQTNKVGHTWPMTPLPFQLPARVYRGENKEYSIHWPVSAFRVM